MTSVFEDFRSAGYRNDLVSLLVCPQCHGSLKWIERAICTVCSASYDVVDGIPILLTDRQMASHDELEHASHKARQAAFFNGELAAEFEISRPHGTPSLYRWLLETKFKRSVSRVQSCLPKWSALAVCGGSGMDAEFLASVGASVIASDISLEAARRTRERSRRYGVPVFSIVADVERLPFADRSVDMAYVHDGLHHLDRPMLGLAEMARVASKAVSITEPARAALTELAVRLGMAMAVEDAGNRVARQSSAEIAMALRKHGFAYIWASRYAMYYRHEPGRAVRFLSAPPFIGAAKLAWSGGDRVLGRVGNKLNVQALREGIWGESNGTRQVQTLRPSLSPLRRRAPFD